MARNRFGGGSSEDSSVRSDADTVTGVDPFDNLGAVDPAASGGGTGDDSGRPDDGSFDPERHAGRDKLNRDGSYRLKRGRKPGGSASAGRKATGSRSYSVKNVENILISIHAMAAAAVAPELALDKDESEPLAEALVEVAKHYDLPAISPVALAWVGLIMVCGKTYGPRAILINERLKAERAERVGNGRVLNFKSQRNRKGPVEVPREETPPANVAPDPYDFG